MVTPEDERNLKRRAWAYGYISRAATPPPAYGSDEWLALPEGPDKWAAVVIAGEALKYEEDHYLEKTLYELEHMAQANKRLDDEEFAARKEAWQQEYGNKSYRPHPVNRTEAA